MIGWVGLARLGGLFLISRRGVRFFGVDVFSESEVDDVVGAVFTGLRAARGS